MYMLVQRGCICFIPFEIGGLQRHGVLLAKEHKDAVRAAKFYGKKSRVCPALIGTVHGESIDSVVRYAESEKRDICLLVGWQGKFPVVIPFVCVGEK